MRERRKREKQKMKNDQWQGERESKRNVEKGEHFLRSFYVVEVVIIFLLKIRKTIYS